MRKMKMSDQTVVVEKSVLDDAVSKALLGLDVNELFPPGLPTLTKAELAELLFEQIGLNKREAKEMVDTFFDEIRTILRNGENVRLSGFGNFILRDKSPRPGRNPKTGEMVPITARRVVTFHASPKLRDMVNQSTVIAPYLD